MPYVQWRKRDLYYLAPKCLWQGYKRAREGVFLDLKMKVKCMCNSAGALTRSRRVVCARVFFFF
jgi:hypothetical protein